MPYSAEISRTNPTCFLFLIDQSSSMKEPFGGQPGKTKADGVADALNRLLQNLALKSTKSDGIRDYFYVGVIGYGAETASALPGQTLIPISQLADNPLRVEQRTRTIDDGAGGLLEQAFKFPVWYEAKAAGKTPMCQALTLARHYLEAFIARYPACYPPLVLNITDGKATDGDPRPAARELTQLATSDGPVLLFNAHLSSTPSPPLAFPDKSAVLPDPNARLLFAMSSELPERLHKAAQAEGYVTPGPMRGFVFNGDLVSVIRFLNIGTRVSQTVR